MKDYWGLVRCFHLHWGRRDREGHAWMEVAIAGEFSRTLISMVLEQRGLVSLLIHSIFRRTSS